MRHERTKNFVIVFVMLKQKIQKVHKKIKERRRRHIGILYERRSIKATKSYIL